MKDWDPTTSVDGHSYQHLRATMLLQFLGNSCCKWTRQVIWTQIFTAPHIHCCMLMMVI